MAGDRPDPGVATAGAAGFPECGRQSRGLPHGARFYRQFTAGDHATRDVLADLVSVLTHHGISDEDLWNLELILAEALNNVAEHAYADGAGRVKLEVWQCRDGLACRVADHGRQMPGDDAPDPPLPVIEPPDLLPEGGFGWHIIRCLTRDLTYRRIAGWNTLTMLLPWAAIDEQV